MAKLLIQTRRATWGRGLPPLLALCVPACLEVEPLAFDRDFGPGSGGDASRPAVDAATPPVDALGPPATDLRPLPADVRILPLPGDSAVSAPDGRLPDARVPDPVVCPRDMDCRGLACGPDPVCGESCGVCAGADVCRAGACMCEDACGARNCGQDACGRSCGACGGRDICVDGFCRCPSACDGRVCGDDLCGGSCGQCEANAACDPDGLCQCAYTRCEAACCSASAIGCEAGRCCEARWRVTLPGGAVDAFVADDAGRLYVGGAAFETPSVWAISACDGSVVAQGGLAALEFIAGGTVQAMAVLADGGLAVTGSVGGDLSGRGDAYFARFDRGDLSTTLLSWLSIAPGPADYFALAEDAAGRLMGVGVGDGGVWVDGEMNRDGEVCGETLGHVGRGRATAPAGDAVWSTGRVDDQLAMVRRSVGCIGPLGVCGCAPPAQDTRVSLPGRHFVEGFGLAVGGETTYAAGAALPDDPQDEGEGVVIALTGAEPARLLTTWSPTGGADTFFDAAVSAGRLYLAGASDLVAFDAMSDPAAVAHLVVVDTGSGAILSDEALGFGVARGVEVRGDAVYVWVDGQNGQDLLRCPLDGPCTAP